MIQHRATVRAGLLGEAIRRRVALYAAFLKPAGGLPPFTEQKTKAEALKFWVQHRHDRVGQQILAGYTPMQVAELDRWLTTETAAANPNPPLIV